MKIAFCTNYISPYRVPVFEHLGSQPGVRLTVFTTSDLGHDRDWDRCDLGRSIVVKRSRSLSCLARQRMVSAENEQIGFTEQTMRVFPLGLLFDLVRLRPDVIVSGELGARTLIAKVAGLVMNVPVIPWTYPSTVDVKAGWVRSIARKLMLRTAPAVIGMGQTARRALVSLGVRDERIFDAPNAADIETTGRTTESAVQGSQVEALSRTMGNRERIAVVVGRLVPMKAPERIVKAWSGLPSHLRERWGLVFVGDGPLREPLSRVAPPGVFFAGSVHPAQIPHYFKACDLHIFASLGDPWGLVVNEAMHNAKPTLCSVHAGCAPDLVREGLTGYLFDPCADVSEITDCLARTLCRGDLKTVGRNAEIHAARFTPARMAMNMLEAVEFAVGTPAQSNARREVA